VQEAVFPNEMLLRGGVKLVEVGWRVDDSGGGRGEYDDVVLRERRRETSRKFGGWDDLRN
jgi:hypothetical protein